MPINYPNFQIDPRMVPNRGWLGDLIPNMMAGYKMSQMPKEMAMQRKKEELANRLAEQQNEWYGKQQQSGIDLNQANIDRLNTENQYYPQRMQSEQDLRDAQLMQARAQAQQVDDARRLNKMMYGDFYDDGSASQGNQYQSSVPQTQMQQPQGAQMQQQGMQQQDIGNGQGMYSSAVGTQKAGGSAVEQNVQLQNVQNALSQRKGQSQQGAIGSDEFRNYLMQDPRRIAYVEKQFPQIKSAYGESSVQVDPKGYGYYTIKKPPLGGEPEVQYTNLAGFNEQHPKIFEKEYQKDLDALGSITENKPIIEDTLNSLENDPNYKFATGKAQSFLNNLGIGTKEQLEAYGDITAKGKVLQSNIMSSLNMGKAPASAIRFTEEMKIDNKAPRYVNIGKLKAMMVMGDAAEEFHRNKIKLERNGVPPDEAIEQASKMTNFKSYEQRARKVRSDFEARFNGGKKDDSDINLSNDQIKDALNEYR